MKLIQELCENIEEEINDSIKYAKLAIEIKDKHPTIAEAVFKLSEEEMKHMSVLHSQVTMLIDEYRKQNGEPPEKMMFLYEVLHKKHIEHAAEARAYQSIYKGQ